MSNSTQITENLLTAVDIVVEEKLRVLDFDRTEQYTIVDNTKASDRIYTVSDGQVNFEAYSLSNADEYKVGDVVIVSIPKSNFSNPEKTILRLATKADDDETGRISYPFDQIVNVSGNLVPQKIANYTYGLAANHYQESKPNSYQNFRIGNRAFIKNDDNEAQPQMIRVADIQDENVLRYTNTCPYIGLSAKFTAPLGQGSERVVSGDYGLKLSLYLDGYNDAPGQIGYITNEDMFGDPYNYVAGATEQKVMYFQYNRTEKSQPEHQITRITIDFFQGGNFYNYQGQLYDINHNQTGDPAFDSGSSDIILDNIFVSEIYLCSAFDKDDYVANKVEISSTHDIIYNRDSVDDNTAKVSLSWLYCGDTLPRLVFEKPKNNMRVRWYAYALGKESDRYGGTNWNFIKESDDFETTISLPLDISQYEVKGVIVDTENSYTSYNTLNFLNYDYIELYQPEYDMRLVFDDGSNGLYPWYNLLNELVEPAEASVSRIMYPEFLDTSVLGPELITQIKWTVPDPHRSMLNYENDGAISGLLTNEYVLPYPDGSSITYIKNTDGVTYSIIARGQMAVKEMFYLKYRIKDTLEYSNTAHIICELQVMKATGQLADKPHAAAADMQFLQESTSGSPYTLIIRSKDNKILTLYNTTESATENDYLAGFSEGLHSIHLEVFMIDQDGQLITFNGNTSDDGKYQLTFKWKNISTVAGTTFSPVLDITDTGLISLPSEYNNTLLSQNYHIAEIIVSALDEELAWQRNITGYYPVPIRRDALEEGFNGTTTIIYNSEGLLNLEHQVFYPLNLQYNGNTEYLPVSYSLNYFDTNQAQDITLSDKNVLQPPHFYLNSFDTTGICALVKNNADVELYSQPILIYQQTWAASLINQWDGKMVVDEENNYILTAMIGAGTKNADNQFSGVLLGNIAEIDSNTEETIQEHTGIYGFRNGAQVYAFRDDGTAFIGSGNGRLNFDGNDARIYNSAMVDSDDRTDPNGTGLLIDFDDALIHTSNIYKGEDGTENPRQRHVYINGFDSKYPFAIGDITYKKNNNSTGGDINVSNANFYIDWDGNLKLSGSITPTGNAITSINNIISNTENYTLLANNIGDLQNQLDSEIDIYIGTLNPLTENIYESDDDLSKKSGDLYYNTETGKVYRFNGDTWAEDNNVSNATIEALKNAAAAQDMADGKRRIIYSTTAPTTAEYHLDKGDLWTNGEDIKVWDETKWINADNYKDTIKKLATGQYTYEPTDLNSYFIEKNTIYSPRIFGGTTLGIGYNKNNESYASVTAEASATTASDYKSLGDNITNPSRWLFKDDYNFRVYPTGGIGIGPVSSLSDGDTSNARYNFMVDNKGNVFANNGKFRGEVRATSLFIGDEKADDYITNIASNAVSDNNDDYLRTEISGNTVTVYASDGTTAVFTCNKAGYLEADNAVIKGSIYTSYGNIGGWTIGTGALSSGTTYLFSEDQEPYTTIGNKSWRDWRIAIGSNFGVDKAGNLVAVNGIFSGTVTATSGSFTGDIYASSGKIGNWTFSSTSSDGMPANSLYYNNGKSGSGITSDPYIANRDTTIITGATSLVNYWAIANTTGDYDSTFCPSSSYWKIIIGPSFGVTDKGALYASNGYFSGTIMTDNGIIKKGFKFGQFIEVDNGLGKNADGTVNNSQYGITFKQTAPQLSNSGLGINMNGVWLRRQDGGWASFNSDGWVAASASDVRLKENINYDLSDYISILKQLKLFSYTLKTSSTGGIHFGVSAQQLHELLKDKNIDIEHFPFLVVPQKGTEFNPKDASTFYQIDYQFLPPLILAIVQEQEKKINQLQSELLDLKTLLREKGVI